jgi:hypothetical protein
VRGHVTRQAGNVLYLKPVPGGVVLSTCLLLIVLVAVGWFVMAQKCKCTDG